MQSTMGIASQRPLIILKYCSLQMEYGFELGGKICVFAHSNVVPKN